MSNSNKVVIPDDYKDVIYRFAYFFIAKLAPYIPKSVKPNQLTLTAFISALIGTFLLWWVDTPLAYIYWMIFNFIWFVFDALDGIHARFTGQTSEFGAFLDHALDNIYFIFMFTAFVVKFDLAHTLYLYIIFLRFTAATIVFVMQSHTNRLWLTKVSGGTEFLLFMLVMALSYAFPNFNPATLTTNPTLLHWINLLSLQQGCFMKVVLWIYFIAVPIVFIMQFKFMKDVLRQSGDKLT